MVIATFLILLVFSAFFSGSETALFSLSKIQLRKLEEKKDSRVANMVVQLLVHPRDLLVTILIGNTLVNIAASACFTSMAITLFGEEGIAIAIGFMVFIILIFGEVTPKTYALSRAERFSSLIAYPLTFIVAVFKPIRKILRWVTDRIVNLFGIAFPEQSQTITEEEIRSLIKIGRREGTLREDEKKMIYSIFDFKDQTASDIMTPKIDIKALDFDSPQEEILKKARTYRHSRLPVYRDSLDNIIGMVYAKDVLLSPNTSIKDILKQAYLIPEQKKIDELLNELQKRSLQMAIVIDEYGLVSGLVTMEDILEEIVGEMRGEYDKEESRIEKLDDKTYKLDGRLHIDEANKKLNLKIKTKEADTMGGFILAIMGRIPEAGEKVRFKNFLFTVNKVQRHRITEILLSKE